MGLAHDKYKYTYIHVCIYYMYLSELFSHAICLLFNFSFKQQYNHIECDLVLKCIIKLQCSGNFQQQQQQ